MACGAQGVLDVYSCQRSITVHNPAWTGDGATKDTSQLQTTLALPINYGQIHLRKLGSNIRQKQCSCCAKF